MKIQAAYSKVFTMVKFVYYELYCRYSGGGLLY